jgi:hypothetical protein
VHFYANKWWLFVSERAFEDASINQEIHLYFATDLLENNWVAHPMNPVTSDARCGRNAGKMFEANGNLYRVSQYSGGSYGRGITISRIIELNEEKFSEEIVEIVLPSNKSRISRIHSYNSNNRFVVADGLRKLVRF